MASPLRKILGTHRGDESSPRGTMTLPRGKKKILKILRRASFSNKKKNSTQSPSSEDIEPVRRPISRKTQQAQDLEDLERLYKELRSAARYFCLVVERKNMDIIMAKIPDNAAIVLDSVISIDDVLTTCIRLQKINRDLIPYRKAVHKCIGDLVRWTDQLLVRGNVKGDLKEGVEFVGAIERSVQELMDTAIPRLRKLELQEEIRNSIFLFEGSSESILVGGENSEEQQVWNKRDSGISEDSGAADVRDSPPPKSPLPHTLRDSGRGSYNCILDVNNGHIGQNDSFFHAQDKYLSPPRRGRHLTLSSRASKDSELSSFSSEDFRSPMVSPNGSQEFHRSAFYSARSSIDGSFYSADEMDNHENDVISATFVGVVENHENAPVQRKKKSFQVYIELLGGYHKPSDDILKRPTSAFDGYEESFRKSISHSSSSSALHTLSHHGHHPTPTHCYQNGKMDNHAFSSPHLPAASPRETHIDWNQNNRSQETPKKKLLSLVEEGSNSCRKSSNVSSVSSSSISSTDEDESTPALDCLDVSRFLVHRDDGQGNMLIGGAIDALIVYAAGASKNDIIFYEAFLTTYRTFISPKDLINKLLYRERRFRERAHKKASQSAFFLLLRVVDELNGKVERSILEQLMKEVYRLICNGDLYVGKILRNKMLPKCDNYYNRSRSSSSPNITLLPTSPKAGCTILDFHSEELAQQLTLIDAANFGAIEIPEILAWGKEQSEANSPNLAVFTDHFNKVSYWSRSYILSFEKQQDRDKVYLKFLKIMKHLRRFNNFNSFLAVLSAMDCSAVRRLDWPKQYLDQLAEYTYLIDSSASFRAYRMALSEARPPCIPYLGLILQDVTFVCLGNVDELPDGKVNFLKRWQLFNILDTFRRFKLMPYEFEVKEDMRQFFAGFNGYLNEDDLFDKSLKLKPRSG